MISFEKLLVKRLGVIVLKIIGRMVLGASISTPSFAASLATPYIVQDTKDLNNTNQSMYYGYYTAGTGPQGSVSLNSSLDCTTIPGGEGKAATTINVTQTVLSQTSPAWIDGMVGSSSGGTGGVGGSGDAKNGCSGYGSSGGPGSPGGSVIMNFNVNSSTGLTSSPFSGTGILAQSVGGNGGNGGTNMNGGIGGVGGTVIVTNNVEISTTSNAGYYGVYAQSLGGMGGTGGSGGTNMWGQSTPGGGGAAGSAGGTVVIYNYANVSTSQSIPLYALSAGGNAGNGGSAGAILGLFPSGSGGSGGYGGPGGEVAIVNTGLMTTRGTGLYGIIAQSVGGGGGAAGYSAGLSAIGANGGYAAPGNLTTLVNSGSILLGGMSSIGLFAQSVGGGGGAGGLATSTSVSMGGTGGEGGNGSTVYVSNSGSIYTGNYCESFTDGACAKTNYSEITSGTNGAAYGILAQSIGGGGGSGGMGLSTSAGVASAGLAVGGQGGSGGSGGQVLVSNSGTLVTREPNSAGILAQSIGGGGGSGGGAISVSAGLIVSFGAGYGGSAGTGGDGGTVGVNCSTSSSTTTNPCYDTGIVLLNPNTSSGTSTYYFLESTPNAGASIVTFGVGSPGILAQSLGGGGGNGGFAVGVSGSSDASLQSNFGGNAGTGGAGQAVYASPAGVDITTFGSDSPGLIASSVGGGGGLGGTAASGTFSGTYSASISMGGSGGSGGYGSAVTVDNQAVNGVAPSAITTYGARSYGIGAQSIGGGGGNGGASISIAAAGTASLAMAYGGQGGSGGGAGNVNLTNDGQITTSGYAASALMAQSIAGGGGNGGMDVAGSAAVGLGGAIGVGGGGGSGGSAGTVTVTNSGTLLTQGAGNAVILAQSIGGSGGTGGISGAGTLAMGSYGFSVGGTGGSGGGGNTVTVNNTGSITSNSAAIQPVSVTYPLNSSTQTTESVQLGGNSPGILAQSIGGTGGNGGYSVGIVLSGGFGSGLQVGGTAGTGGSSQLVTVTNSGAGQIATSGTMSSAIMAQSFGGNGGNGGMAAGGSMSGEFAFSTSIAGSGGSGGQAGAVSVTNSATPSNNQPSITTNGSMSSGILAQSVGGSGGNGGLAVAGSIALDPDSGTALTASVGGSAGTGATAGTVTVTNSAGIDANGDQSAGIVAQSIGGIGGNGGNAIAGGVSATFTTSVAISGRGATGSTANQVKVNANNSSGSGTYTISTDGLLANAITAQSIGGSGGNAGTSFSGGGSDGVTGSVSIAGDGGAGGTGGPVIVSTGTAVVLSTLQDQSSGIVAQSIGGSGGNGGLAASASIATSASANLTVGGSGASGGSANTVTVTNNSTISTMGMLSLGIIAQSIGGSGGNGGASYGGSLSSDGSASVNLGGTCYHPASQSNPATYSSTDGSTCAGGSANTVNVYNYAGITTAQSQSTAILAQSIGGVGGNGGSSAGMGLSDGGSATITVGGVGGDGGQGGAVQITNTGTINVVGNQSLGLVGQSIGGSGGNGGSSINGSAATGGSSGSLSVGANGGSGGTANTVSITSNTGTSITTDGLSAIGILGQSIGGAGGNGGNSYSLSVGTPSSDSYSASVAVGGAGGQGGTSNEVTITQTGSISTVNTDAATTGTTNDQSVGIVAQSIGGNGGNGGNATSNAIAGKGTLSLSIGGQGGYGANAYDSLGNGAVTVYSNQGLTTGGISTDGMQAAAILAQSIGGGGGNGGWSQSQSSSGTTSGNNSYGLGFSLGGWGGNGGNASTVNVYSGGTLTTTGQQSSAIVAQSIGGGGGNGGASSTQTSTTPGSAASGLVSVVGAQINNLTGIGSQASTYLATQLVNSTTSSSTSSNSTPQPTNSNSTPDSGISASMAVGGFGGNAGNGNDVTVTSSSIISTAGAHSNGVTAQSIGGGGGNGGSSTSGADGGKYSAAMSVGGFGGDGGTSGLVTVTNLGVIQTTGDYAYGIYAQSIGGGGGSGGSSSATSQTNAGGAAAVSLSVGGWGGSGGNSGTSASAGLMQVINVTNDGIIRTTGMNSAGIFAQSVGGGGGNGGSSSTSSKVASKGASGSSSAGTGGSTSGTTNSVSNTANSSVAGQSNTASSGGAQYTSQSGANNGTAVGLTVGGYGGSGGFANNVEVTNNGLIVTGYAATAQLSLQRLSLGLSDNSAAIFAQSVGGGGGNGGSGTSNADGSKTSVSLALGGGGGTGGDAGTVTVGNTGNLLTFGNNSAAVFAQSVGGGGGNGGSASSTAGTGGSNAVALGLGGSGGNGGTGNTVTVDSSVAGITIATYGAQSHAIFAQSVGGGGGNGGAVNVASQVTTSSNGDSTGSSNNANGAKNSSPDPAPTGVTGQTTSTASSGVSVAAGLGGSGGSGGNAGSVVVTNVSQVATAGTGSYGILAQSVGGGGGNSGSSTVESNGGAYNAAFTLGMSGTGGGSGQQVSVTSTNDLSTLGDNAIGIFAQSVGGGGGNAGSTSSTSSTNQGDASVSMALGGSGGAAGSGGVVGIITDGSVTTYGKNAAALFAQSVGGGGGNGASTQTSAAGGDNSVTMNMGGGGGAAGGAGTVNVNSIANLITYGDHSQAIFAQSVGGGGGNGGASSGTASNGGSTTVTLTMGGSGTGGADGTTVTVDTTVSGYNTAANTSFTTPSAPSTLQTAGDFAQGIFAQSVGGGGGNGASSTSTVNTSSDNSSDNQTNLALSLGGQAGNGGAGGDVNVTNAAYIVTSGLAAQGIFAQSVGGGGGNGGSGDTSASGNSTAYTLGLGANGGSGGAGGVVNVLTVGSITTTGDNASAILAQSVGGGGGNGGNSSTNLFGAQSSTVSHILGGVGGSGGVSGAGAPVAPDYAVPPPAVTVDTSGSSGALIQTTGQNSIAIMAQSIGGGGGNSASVINGSAISGSNTATFALGGTGISAGNTGAGNAGGSGGGVSMINSAQVLTTGDNAVGMFGQSVGGGGGTSMLSQQLSTASNLTASFSLGGGYATGTTGAQSVNGDGGVVSMLNTGSITTLGANAIGMFGQSIGGGGGYVAATISGGSINLNSSMLGGNLGSSGNGNAVTITNQGAITTLGAGSVGIVAQSVGGGGGYVSIVSKDANGTLNNPTNLQLGQLPSGSASGNGGNVVVTNSGVISTSGANAVGILAQSVGGGGGAFVTSGLGTITPTYNAGTGTGGSVHVIVHSPIYTTGAGAYGVVAESVGGGGGLSISGTTVTKGGGEGKGLGGEVRVDAHHDIYATGQGAIAIYAHTVNGDADPYVYIAPGRTVSASGGASAVVLDGANNTLENRGSILVADLLNDYAVDIRSPGVNDIQNYGVMSGSINNAAGASVSMTNNEGSRFESAGGLSFLGTGTFTNKGYYISHLNGQPATANESFSGTFNQTNTGVLGIKLDQHAGLSDLISVEGSGALNLAGKIRTSFLNPHLIVPGTVTKEILRTNSVGASMTHTDLAIESTAIMSMDLIKSADSVQIVSTANFAPAGMSKYGTDVGTAIGSYQAAGSNAFFQAATAQLVTIADTGALDQAYQGLAGTSIQAVPQVTFQAVSRSIDSFTQRLNDWRLGSDDTGLGRTASTKNRIYASSRPPQTMSDAGEPGLLPGGRSGPWISFFQSSVYSNSLTDRILGGTLGYEFETDARDTVGGIGFTMSQSGYSYNSAPTPITPGNTQNFGLSFYGNTKVDAAYFSGIGYLGGGNTNFTRQIQTLGFNTSDNVNIKNYTAAGRFEAGYAFLPFKRDSSHLKVTPFAAVQPTYIYQPGTTENISGYGSGFTYSANQNVAVPVFVGTEFSGTHQFDSGLTVNPFLRVSWMAETQNKGSMGSSYGAGQGVSVYFNGSPNLGNAMIYNAGTTFGMGKHTSGFVSLDYDYGNQTYGYRAFGTSFGVKYAF